MNLKEAFRYQNLLEKLMTETSAALTMPGNLMKVTKKHLRSKANSTAQDDEELPDETEVLDADALVAFMNCIVTEREALTTAIGLAKKNLTGAITDLDAAVEANKYRQMAANRIKAMLRTKESKRVTSGTAYNFNAEGTQVPYVYDIEVSSTLRFDRVGAKATMQRLLTEADKVSSAIDEVMVNTVVNYDAPWDVNDSFEDVFAEFVEGKSKA